MTSNSASNSSGNSITSQGLSRSLGLKLTVVVVVGNIIGSGVYKKVAPMTAELHSQGWVLICWVVAGIISCFGALCNAEVAGMLADTGGEYVYFKKIYNKFFAFLFGWSLFTVIQTASIAALAYIFAESLNSIFTIPPALESWGHISLWGFEPFHHFNIKLTAILLIVILTFVNSRGVKIGTGLSSAILLMVFAGILIVVAFGLTSGHANISQAFQLDTSDGSKVGFSGFFTAMLGAFWAYQGWASVGYVGGEIKNANKNIPRGIAIGVAMIITLYLLANVTYLSLLSVPQLEYINTHSQIASVEAVRVFWGSYGAIFLSLIICLTTLGCVSATILTSGRIYFAMAREGLFFPSVAKLNAARVPVNSLTFQAVWAIVLVLSGTFDQLTDMIIFAVFIYYGATTLGLFILRKRMPDAPRPYKVWGYPVVPAIVILFCIGLFFNTIVTKPDEAKWGIILMLTGVPMYYYFVWRKRKEGRQS